MLSDEGTKTLFDANLSLGEDNENLLIRNLNRITRMNEVYFGIKDCYSETTNFLNQNDVLSRKLYGVLSSANDFIFGWMGGSIERSRDRFLKTIASGSPGLKSAAYQEAKKMYPDITEDEDQFYINFQNGKYDNRASFLHSSFSKPSDNVDYNPIEEYAGIAYDSNARPVVVVANEGKEGVQKGTAFYVDSVKKVITAGVDNGDKLVEGIEKAEEVVKKIKEVEEKGVTQTAIDYLKESATSNIKDKVKGFIEDKTGIEVTDELEDVSTIIAGKLQDSLRAESVKFEKLAETETTPSEATITDDWGWSDVGIDMNTIAETAESFFVSWIDESGASQYFLSSIEEGEQDGGKQVTLPSNISSATASIIASNTKLTEIDFSTNTENTSITFSANETNVTDDSNVTDDNSSTDTNTTDDGSSNDSTVSSGFGEDVTKYLEVPNTGDIPLDGGYWILSQVAYNTGYIPYENSLDDIGYLYVHSNVSFTNGSATDTFSFYKNDELQYGTSFTGNWTIPEDYIVDYYGETSVTLNANVQCLGNYSSTDGDGFVLTHNGTDEYIRATCDNPSVQFTFTLIPEADNHFWISHGVSWIYYEYTYVSPQY